MHRHTGQCKHPDQGREQDPGQESGVRKEQEEREIDGEMVNGVGILI